MVTYRSRGEIINQTETVQLRAAFYSSSTGELTDLDLFPTIKIIQPSGNLALGPTSAGVYHLSTGLYGFDYALGVNSSLGVWTDFWQGKLVSDILVKELNFVVQNTQMPMINSDGYVALGDDAPFHFSQTAIVNLNKLIKGLKARLNSSGKSISYDQFGNKIYVDCDIFDPQSLVTFLTMSLSLFNQVPYFTAFTFDDTEIITIFFSILIQGATIYALASKALIEKGREFTVSDSGISFNPASLGDLISSQWNTELTNHTEMIKYLKNSMRSAPMGLGVMSLTSGGRFPIVNAMRMRREGNIF